MTDDAELLPCPFCGSERLKQQIVTNTGGNVRYIWCMECNAMGPWFGSGHPDNRWNTRAAAPRGPQGLTDET